MTHALAEPLIAAPDTPDPAALELEAQDEPQESADLRESPPALAALEAAAGVKLAPWLESERRRWGAAADARWGELLGVLCIDLHAELGHDSAACVLALLGFCDGVRRPSIFGPACREWSFDFRLRGRRAVEVRYAYSEVRCGWVRRESPQMVDGPGGLAWGRWVVDMGAGQPVQWCRALGDALYYAGVGELPPPEAPDC